MRQFFAYGFRSRDEFDAKSARSYDNEKRRIESWLGEYMSFRQESSGKSVFLSVDSRRIPNNPLYKAWKAASFTKNDVSLHFILLDILADGNARTMSEILDSIDADYLSAFKAAEPFDESTLRKKLKEYAELGLITAEKQGKQYVYSLPSDRASLETWREAVSFFSEDDPMGVIGSYVLDKYEDASAPFFTFKHRYLLFALDSGIMLDLFTAIHSRERVELELVGGKNRKTRRSVTLPLKIYISVQGGRQYLAAYNYWKRGVGFYRLDSILKVKPLETVPDYEKYQEYLQDEQPHIWGVALGQKNIEHIEMILTIDPKDSHIVHRLEREKRCGTIAQIDDTAWRFTADVYDALELMPWLRTFIGRIASLTCSNKRVEEQFWSDLSALDALYGGDDDAV
jgi:DNA-binding transcriptional ArsR family regulator